MSKGNKAVCIRFAEPLMGGIEEEAAALGITVPELCRRIIAERNQAIARAEVRAVQTTPNTRPAADSIPIDSPRSETQASNPVVQSQKSEASRRAGWSTIVDRQVMQMIKENHPDLFPTEAMKKTRTGLRKFSEEHPEEFNKFIADQIASGKMSVRALVRFLELLYK